MFEALPWLMQAMGGAGGAAAGGMGGAAAGSMVPGNAFQGMPTWMNALQGAVNSPNPESMAPMMAQAGDPQATMQLFGDTNQWSPLMPESDPLLNPQNQQPPGMGSFNAGLAQATGQAVPQIPMGGGTNAPNVPPPAPGLTPEQQKQLLGMMPDQRSNYAQPPAAPSPGRPALQGNMQQLQAAPIQQQRRLTLADLIYGAR